MAQLSNRQTADYLAYNESPMTIRALSAVLVLTTVVVALRFWVRMYLKIRLGWEDWFMAIALPLAWAIFAIATYCILYGGFGRHLETVMSMDPNGQIFQRGLYGKWIGEIVYISLITTIKLSALIMYYRIFPTRVVKSGVAVLGVITEAWFISSTLLFILQCIPIQKAWVITSLPGKCIDRWIIFLWNTVFNIVTGVAFLGLPMYEVYHLRIKIGDKIGIAVIFLLGGLVIIFSVIKLKASVDIVSGRVDGTDPVEINRLNIWSIVEPAVGMVSASIPPLRPLIPMLGRAFGISSSKLDRSSQNKGNRRSIVTIGGSGPSGRSRSFLRTARSGTETITSYEEGSFERLPDAEFGSQNELHTIRPKATSSKPY
ncbi:uncharacterized protein F4822DRAFT_366608 [Hypoxylon trugodes]|uniref:uncharacterized protein n=1 Tax=Hypoxylon trugodes TaxID=326681 RepID=UPI00218F36BE|nr:uncharacterized protein F4822DRAFT_366608 [Hypoxylon trugodes]KAI1384549.1 hypothetical protein F4822DRAFT_366608 [Hypoxylon trugodes]